MRFFEILLLIIALAQNLSAAPSPVHSDAVSNFIAGLSLSDTYCQESFRRCFPNTLDTTITLEGDNTTYVITGDIDAMWIRDSTSQINPYIYLCRNDANLKRVIKGTILRHIKHFNIGDPFVNSWNENYTVHESKYEPDNAAYFIRLCWLYWKVSGDTSWTNGTGDFDCHNAFNRLLDKIRIEQTNHSPYTGLVYTLFRPSDDDTVYRYHVPDNMFIASMLPKMKEMYQAFWPSDAASISRCQLIRDNIMSGLTNFALYSHPVYGKIWAYEVDGNGNFLLMDDANVPSLLSAPYIEFCSNTDPVYQNTRQFLLSASDPYYYSGSFARGIGSYHTAQVNPNRLWPMSVIIEAFTSGDESEISRMLTYLNGLDDGTHFMHEGVDVNDPSQYSRSWFAWANTLYGEFVVRKVLGIHFYPGDGVYVKPQPDNHCQALSMTNGVSFGDVNSLKIKIDGTGSQIISAFINGVPALADAVKGVKVTSDPASIVIHMRTNTMSLKMVSLTGYFNRDGMSWDSGRSDGTISGTGNTTYDAMYLPDILYSSYSGLGFRIGSKVNGQNNVLSCNSQVISLTNVLAAKIHILAVGINGNQTGTFRVHYKDSSYDDVLLHLTDWCADVPLYGEEDAVLMGHRHDSGSDQAIKCHVYEYILFLNRNKILDSVTLPANPNITVLALDISDFNSAGSSFIPTDKVPKFVIGLEMNNNGTSQNISWRPVIRNIDNSLIDSSSLISFYRVYRSTDLVNWSLAGEVTNTTFTYPFGDYSYFKITALNKGLKEGTAWSSVSSSSNQFLLLINSFDNALMAKAVIPPALGRQLLRDGNLTQDDLWIKIENLPPDEETLYKYEVKVLKYSSDETISDLSFSSPLRLFFYYKVDPVTGYIEDTTISSEDAPSFVKTLRYNKVEWVFYNGTVDTLNNSITITVEGPGLFAVSIKNAGQDEFNLMQMEPRKIFSPGTQAPNNEMHFYFHNPLIKKAVCTVFSMTGEKVKELPVKMNSLTDGYFYWNGRDGKEKSCANGVYLYQMECGGKVISGSVILAR